jgi:hypothetical protein
MKIYSIPFNEDEVKHLKHGIESRIERKESLLKQWEDQREDMLTERNKIWNENRITDVKNRLNELRPILEKLNRAK